MATPRDAGTTAFAQRLSELRDGSGRSYGSLARRVDIRTSTLHRYCSGQTVPLDFAPVERLARFCGCDDDELTALHRLWVRADAERRLRQESAARSAGAPAARKAADETAPAASDTPPESPEVLAADPAPHEPPLADPTLADPAPHEPPAVSIGARPPAGPPPGTARRGRRIAYATGFATAVALTLLVAFVESPLSGTDRPRTTAEQPDTEATGFPLPRPGSSRPTPSASPDATASGPADHRRPGTTGHHKSSPPAAASKPSDAPSKPGSSTKVPFTWSTNDHIWQNGCAHSYLLDRDPAEVPPPPVQADAEPWARSVGALHGADTRVRITVQGRSEEPVVLESVRVRVTARRAPVQRSVFRTDSGCGGSLTPRLFDVDLDDSVPRARSVAGNDAGEPIPAVSFPYKVSATDPELLLVVGRTAGCDCDWYLELQWRSGDRSGSVRIDDNGRPFRTSGVQGRPVYDYDTGARRWVPAASISSTYSPSEAASPTAQP